MLNESKPIEYKREFTGDIKKTVAAFANTDGGKIFIGIDNEKQVVSLKEPDHVFLQVGNLIRDSIRPDVTLFTDLTISEQDGKPIVVIDMQRGTARPYYIAGKGIRPEGVYVRQGSATVPASESAILQMIKDTSGDSYENARSLNQNLSFEMSTIIFNKQKIAFGKSQKKSLHLIASDGTYTNLGLLLSEQCSHTIKIAVFEGDTKKNLKNSVSLPVLCYLSWRRLIILLTVSIALVPKFRDLKGCIGGITLQRLHGRLCLMPLSIEIIRLAEAHRSIFSRMASNL